MHKIIAVLYFNAKDFNSNTLKVLAKIIFCKKMTLYTAYFINLLTRKVKLKEELTLENQEYVKI